MKKIIFILGAIFFGFVLSACNTEGNYVTTDDIEELDLNGLTEYEFLQVVKEDLDIPYKDGAVENLILPRNIRLNGKTVLVSWESQNKAYLNDTGGIFRPDSDKEDVTVQIVANMFVENGVSRDSKTFDVTIKKIPATTEAKLTEAVERMTLIENNEVYLDTIVLPRTGAFASKITWQTSDASIIDLDGNVTETTSDQNVKLTATFELDGKTKTSEFDVTVKSSSENSPETISTNDAGIKRTVEVDDKIKLIQAIQNAEPGDAIVIADGAYDNLVITMENGGTAENPIYIMAKNPGRTYFTGVTQFNIFTDHVTLSGLDFRNGSPNTDKGVVVFEGDHLRLTNTRIFEFELSGNDYKWVSLTGMYHEVDRNLFEKKTTGGALLTVWRDDNTPQYHHIHNNHFKDYEDSGGANGYETIRIGTSHQSQSDSYVTVENNLFERISGEIEIISLKSGRNVIRNNTYVDSLGHITARHGKNNLIEGNSFFANHIDMTGGIRIYDGGHIIRNNYFDSIMTSSNTRGGIVIHSGVNVPGTTTVMNAQWTAFNVLVEGNTIVDSRQSILVGGKFTHAAKDVIIKDNFIVSHADYAAIRHDKLLDNPTFENNFVYSSVGYSGGGSVTAELPSSGVMFGSDISGMIPSENTDGLHLHGSYGAQDVTKVSSDSVGPNWL